MAKQINCTEKDCRNFGRYCRIHIQGSLKPAAPIKKESKKRAEVKKKEYLPIVREMLSVEKNCRVKSPVCTKTAQGLHHLKGRTGELYTDKRYLVPCCNACNQWLEKNDAWARANGFKLSKFNKAS